jgi:hypothetical protein
MGTTADIRIVKTINGTIVLPTYLKARWRNVGMTIREYGSNRIVLERVSALRKRRALHTLKAAAGILKGKIPDPVKWQRTIRKEWDRSLPSVHVHD